MNTTEKDIDIDNIDLAIMTLINNADRPLWKNRIHERLHDDRDALPITTGVSVQTVGRRVDTLQDKEHLETVIASPDDLKRDLIIAFKLTDQGQDILTQKQELILKDIIHETLFSKEKHTDIGKEALVALINDHFAGEDTQPLSAHDHEEKELLSILTMYYAEQEAMNVFSKDDKDALYQTVSENGLIPIPSIKEKTPA